MLIWKHPVMNFLANDSMQCLGYIYRKAMNIHYRSFYIHSCCDKVAVL